MPYSQIKLIMDTAFYAKALLNINSIAIITMACDGANCDLQPDILLNRIGF